MKTEIKTVDVTLAEEMLRENVKNRIISREHVAFLSDQMASGEWKFNGDPIRFDMNGKLLDGQHRLLSIVKSGKPQEFLIISGIPDEAQITMDTGKLRNGSDILSLNGFSDATCTAACASLIMRYNEGAFSEGGKHGKTKSKFTNKKILAFCNENNLYENVLFGNKCARIVNILSRAEFSFLHYVLNKKDSSDAELFLSKLVEGACLSEGDPVLYVRNRLIKNKISHLKMSQRSKLELLFKGWNCFRKGVTIKYLTLSGNELPKIR